MAKQRQSKSMADSNDLSQGLASPSQRKGKVYLVGAGPGDAGLITWRGVECLRAADVVLYDYLVNPAILRHASGAAELFCLGRHRASKEKIAADRIWDQAEINQQLVQMARAGRRVVRLKSGDPVIFGRLAEEATALEAAKI